ncbi:hypothetical protein F8388_013542 [Cannabis sativa]|uniref:Potassium channel domain-containing protein n=1 Tax=Cannabis sativa TaxID=3483 RepID=A0A7J6G8S1_CANSA|nr:hypothetical protein F8388_013542 [Cannabis sativa]
MTQVCWTKPLLQSKIQAVTQPSQPKEITVTLSWLLLWAFRAHHILHRFDVTTFIVDRLQGWVNRIKGLNPFCPRDRTCSGPSTCLFIEKEHLHRIISTHWTKLYWVLSFVVFVCTMMLSPKTKESTNKIDLAYLIIVSVSTVGYGDIKPVALFCYFQRYILPNMARAFSKTPLTRIKKFDFTLVTLLFQQILGITTFYREYYSIQDSVYASLVTSMTIGYENYSFHTQQGRIFATIWIIPNCFVFSSFLSMIYDYFQRRNNLKNLKNQLTTVDLAEGRT